MAQYRFSPAIVSRGKGQSIVAKAAYNARENIRDERTGEMKRHGHRQGLEFSGIFAPKNAPEWMKDRAKLWNAVERQEDGTTRPTTAQLARNIELNLPHELNADQRRQLVRDFVREQFVRQGMVADVAIHAPDRKGDERNYHAHILLTLRKIDGNGFSAEKAREWNSKAFNLQWREKWAELGARYLEKAGFAKEAERYSYAHFDKEKQRQIAIERGDHEHAQALEQPATQHKGPQIVGMERRGIDPDPRDSFAAQHETAKLKLELATIDREIARAEREAEREAQREVTARPIPANDNTRPAWVERRGGYDALPPQLQRRAQADFNNWKNHGPGRGTSHDIRAYVGNVQDLWNAGQRPGFRKATEEVAARPQLRSAANTTREVGQVARRGIGKGLNIGGAALNVFVKGLESLFAPQQPLTRAQIEEENKRHDAAANDQERAFAHDVRDTEHQRSRGRETEAANQKEIEREQYERLNRGGRERER